eukprot:3878987-Pyramimonas_sp.AAC.2
MFTPGTSMGTPRLTRQRPDRQPMRAGWPWADMMVGIWAQVRCWTGTRMAVIFTKCIAVRKTQRK